MEEFLEDGAEGYLATVTELLEAERSFDLAEILRSSKIRVDQTGYDNWNGGTNIWTIYIEVAPHNFVSLDPKREAFEKNIESKFAAILGETPNDWYSVSIVASKLERSNWRDAPARLQQGTIQNIIDGLRIERTNWAGSLDEVQFLGRIFNLEDLPSQDHRFDNAARDIWQHRINNPDDWEDDWIFDDSRFNLHKGSSETFLRFLCQIVHPVVRPDKNEAVALVSQFNDQLRRDGWQLVVEEKIAGRPRYVAQPVLDLGTQTANRARSVADALNAAWMQKEIERLEASVDADPALAIGTAKELVETCCKSILGKLGVSYAKSAKLQDLTKSVLKELKLVPDSISDKAKGAETVKLILRNLAALTNYLAELRNLYGSGHGKDGQYVGLEPRHARIAVGAAVTFIDLVTSTYHKQASSIEEDN